MFSGMTAPSIANLSEIASFLDLSKYPLMDLLRVHTQVAVEAKEKMDAAAGSSTLLKMLGAGSTSTTLHLHGLKATAPNTELKSAKVLPVDKDATQFQVELLSKNLTDKTESTEILSFDDITCSDWLRGVIIEALKDNLIPHLLSKKLAALAQEQLSELIPTEAL